MSANLVERRRLSAPKLFPVSPEVIDRRRRLEPIRRVPRSSNADDEERNFISKAAAWMVVLAFAPAN